MSSHYEKSAATTGAHSGEQPKAIHILKKNQVENQSKDSVPLYVKVTLSVLIVINFFLFIFVAILMANVFGTVAESRKPLPERHIGSGVEVGKPHAGHVEIPSPTPGGVQEGAAGGGEGMVHPPVGAGGRRAVMAHVYMNSTRLKQDRATMRPHAPRRRMRSCELGYEVRHSGVVQGVGYNETTARLKVTEPGFYYIYSQVVFDKVPTRKPEQPFSDSLFHVICKSHPMGRQDSDLLQATETPNRGQCDVTSGTCTGVVFHTSHVGGIVRLVAGDTVYVKVSDLNIVHMTGKGRGSFFGLHKI